MSHEMRPYIVGIAGLKHVSCHGVVLKGLSIQRGRPKKQVIEDVDVVFLKGSVSLYNETVRDQLDMKIYVDTDLDIMLLRRIEQDEKGNLQNVLDKHKYSIKPAYDTLIHPSMKFADIIILGVHDSHVAVECITLYIQLQFDARKKASVNRIGDTAVDSKSNGSDR
ncbi:uridine kinase family-domain-containing protein [Sporodiniella umbellata]|nr:uridine kinase family-domain-containing protein [Sporodiniella umbellata]